MENYEQKYNEAIKRLKKAFTPVNGCEISGLSRSCVEQIFPELKESEDERIRKEILQLVSISGNGNQKVHSCILSKVLILMMVTK